MNNAASIFITLGTVFLLGLAFEALGRRTALPRVTMLVILGFLIGPEVLNALPSGYEEVFGLGAKVALTMVGFLLGEHIVLASQGGGARAVLSISVAAVVLTSLIVFVGLTLLGVQLEAALLLGGVASATDPAATIDVVQQLNAKSRMSRTLLGVVAVDDAWGVLLFSLLMAVASGMSGDISAETSPLWEAGREIGGAVVLGVALGLPMAALTGRIAPGEPTLLEAGGMVFLASGLALWFDVSFILTAMILGAVVALRAKHHEYPFHAIERIELPFMILFFVLAGASLDLSALASIGLAGLAYILLRAIGRVSGGWVGARLSGESQQVQNLIGLTLMPQAGVALGMAILASQRFPEVGEMVLQIAVGSTVVFELLGPVVSRWALQRAEVSSLAPPR